MDQSEPTTLTSPDATAATAETPPAETPPAETPPADSAPADSAPGPRRSVSVPAVAGIVIAVVALTAGLLAYQSLSDQLDERSDAIDELEQDVDELATDLAALEAGRTELRADVQANQDAIADAGTRTETLEAQAARLESLISGGLADGNQSDSVTEVAVPTAGDGLPPMVANGEADPALGMQLPDIEGTDHLTGDPVAVTAGTSAVIMVWAHWCPYCQRELPVLQQLVDEGVFADNDIDLLTIATFEDESRGNPFEDYVTEFSFPVIRDDLSRAGLLGVSAVPSWIVVGADGATLGRFSGAVGEEALRQIIDQITAIGG